MSRLNIVQGEDKDITVRLSLETGDPYDLSSVTAISAEFPAAAGGCVTITGVSPFNAAPIVIESPSTSGKITLTLSDTETALLASGTSHIELIIDEGTDRKIIQFKNSLNVLERLC